MPVKVRSKTTMRLSSRIIEKLDQPRCRVAGVVVGTIDQMLHGIVNGTDGMHAGVRHWAKRGSLGRLLDAMLERGFEVILTADHGNVEGVGIGKPNVGATADERGERVHVFSDPLLRSNVAEKYPGSLEWPCIGLPDDYLALLPHRSALSSVKESEQWRMAGYVSRKSLSRSSRSQRRNEHARKTKNRV